MIPGSLGKSSNIRAHSPGMATAVPEVIAKDAQPVAELTVRRISLFPGHGIDSSDHQRVKRPRAQKTVRGHELWLLDFQQVSKTKAVSAQPGLPIMG